MSRTILIACGVLVLLVCGAAKADTGTLTPFFDSEEQPADRLALSDMEIRLVLDHGMAHVEMMQIFTSHDDRVLEGRYRLIIPEWADIGGFAVWDDLVRIPGVILEKAKAKRLFDEIARASIDPGLMAGDDETSMVNEFIVSVAPIAPHGSKRLELRYSFPAPIERGRLDFTLPLKPDAENGQLVERLAIEVTAADGLKIAALAFHGERLAPEVTDQTETGFRARFGASRFNLDEDLSFTVEYEMPAATVDLVAYRDVEQVDWNISPTGGHYQDRDGYYQARLLFPPQQGQAVGNRNIVLVVDGSLSMLGDKLLRTVELIGALGKELSPDDRITLLFANSETTVSAGPAQPVSPEWLTQLDVCLRAQTIAGGLDLAQTLAAAGSLCVPGKANQIVLLSDGHPTVGLLRYPAIVESFVRSPGAAHGARLFAIGIGDDANRTLLSQLAAAADGHYAWCADTADATALAKSTAARLSAAMLRRLQLLFRRADNVFDSYPATIPAVFAGSETTVVGRFKKPGDDTLTLRYQSEDGQPVEKTVALQWPEKQTDHDGIRRRWAKARVDYLLERIRTDGEKAEWIAEIVALSKRFTFVTPYTSFLAAPRALLRPRVIRPGDPLLRVRTSSDIKRVTAVFPFGLTAPLQYLPDENIWQVRFLAPADYPDGAYVCRLVLIDQGGHQYIETKSFVLDSQAPVVKAAMPTKWRAGSPARLAVTADADTRRLLARLPGAPTVGLHWDEKAMASVGYLDLPAGTPPGRRQLEIYAEDFAHNVSRTLVEVEVTP